MTAISHHGYQPARDYPPLSVIKKSRRAMYGWGPRIEHTPPAVFGGGGGRKVAA